MKVTIEGHVIGLAADYKADLLLLEQHDGKRSNTVAVRCWTTDSKRAANEFRNGDLVSVTGRISSRQGKTGDRWFTSYEAEQLRLVKSAEALPPVTQRPSASDDEPPF